MNFLTSAFQGFSWLSGIVFIFICEAVGGVGSIFTASKIPTWYAGLTKPSFNPPSWVFGPVWTILYALMGIAVSLVWQRRAGHPLATTALWLFGIQLFLNGIWTPIFFGAQNLGLALVVIVAMWIAILLTIIWFWRILPLAGMLLVPYLAWVSFATLLNYSLWQLNK